jgi:hypothetical protein
MDYFDPFDAPFYALDASFDSTIGASSENNTAVIGVGGDAQLEGTHKSMVRNAGVAEVGAEGRAAAGTNLLRELVEAVSLLSKGLGNNMRLYPWRWLVSRSTRMKASALHNVLTH